MVLGMTPWFSATVAAPGMMAEWGATPSVSAWLTIAVQLGFVLGTFVSAVLLLSDRLSARRLASGSSFVVTIATAALAWRHTGPTGAIILSGFTGVALAGVYPPGIKIVAGWWRAGRGTAIGIFGRRPHDWVGNAELLRAVAPVEKWRSIILAAASCALCLGGFIRPCCSRRAIPGGIGTIQSACTFDGSPQSLGGAGNRGLSRAHVGALRDVELDRSLLGYVIAPRAMAAAFAPVFAFVTVASGAVGCVVAGLAADRCGRPIVTIVAMAISATCALAIGFLATAPLVVVTVVAVVWGISIVADSAQFSAAITELAPSQYVGTAITLQTCLGFLLTIVTIRLVPVWVHLWGWELAYVPLAIGPAAGILAMWPLWRARSRGAS
jgi:MFS family permease